MCEPKLIQVRDKTERTPQYPWRTFVQAVVNFSLRYMQLLSNHNRLYHTRRKIGTRHLRGLDIRM
jgi:hypothetical protein